MTERFITAPNDLTLAPTSPLIFLAGPIQGAENWQASFANHLLATLPNAYVASPRRTLKDRGFDAEEQVAWEHSALERARTLGTIAFWWAAQDHEDSTYPYGRAYAQTTRIEFGKTSGWKQFQPDLPVIVGYDPLYAEHGGGSEGYVRKEASSYGIPVYDSRDAFIRAVCAATRQLLSPDPTTPSSFTQ